MKPFLEIRSPEDLAKIEASASISLIEAEQLHSEAPDAHWVLLGPQGTVAAHCSLWWTHVPPYGEEKVGVIGHFAAADLPSAGDLLRHATAQLAAKGCTVAIGPMDGNTWRRYRFVVERGSEPPFFLEPHNPDDWPQYFVAAGFAPMATYVSALNKDVGAPDVRLSSIRERVDALGITVRQANPAHMEQELRRVYNMSLASFQRNFLYTPLGEPEFLTQYKKVLPFACPQLILIAERKDETVGFLFSIPDILRPQRGEPNDTIIIKTVAVLPDCAALGLGTLLVGHAQQLAAELGFHRAIHALMHESNRSRNISNHTASTMRRYALFARRLAP